MKNNIFRIVVLALCGVLTAEAGPVINTQPVGFVALAGQSATVSVTASGAGPLSYQWIKDGGLLPGQTSSSISFNSFQLTDTGSYQAVVSNASGITITLPALVCLTNAPLRNWGVPYLTTPTDTGSTPWLVASNVAAAAVGNFFNMYIMGDGTLWGFGQNNWGVFGDGTQIDRPLPLPVASNVVAVAAGLLHVLYVTSDGKLWAIGGNSYGQLGVDNAGEQDVNGPGANGNPYVNIPVFVTNNVVAVSAGDYHSLFVTADGNMWAMGNSVYGQLGTNGSTTVVMNDDEDKYYNPYPVLVAGNVVAVAAGDEHSLFITADEKLWSMGYNAFGQLGNNVPFFTNLPSVITNSVVSVAAGTGFSAFATADGNMWWVGFNTGGELSDGRVAGTNVPQLLASGVVEISAEAGNAYFVSANGNLLGLGEAVDLGTPYNGIPKGSPNPNWVPTPLLIDGGGLVTATIAKGESADQGLAVAGQVPIVAPMTNQRVSFGQPFSFTASTQGDGPFSYTWSYSTGDDDPIIPGATTATYSVASASATDPGIYTVTVSGAYGTTSESATLTLNLSLASAAGAPGLANTATGYGFLPGESVNCYYNSILLGSATADPVTGAVVVPYVTPLTNPTGTYLVTLTGQNSLFTSSASFNQNAPLATLATSSGIAGSANTAMGCGFKASELVSFYYNNTFVGEVAANVAGEVTEPFSVPSSFLPGTYNISLTGLVSRLTASASFDQQGVSVFSGLTPSKTITNTTPSVTLNGTVIASGPSYPPSGETITVTINGNAQTTQISDGAGDFSINYNSSAIPPSKTSYPVTYSYAGDANFVGVTNTSKLLIVQWVPTFSGLTPGQSVTSGATSIILSGSVSASGSVFPGIGESVSVTINGNTQTTYVSDNTGDFAISYNPSAIPASKTSYPITYSYAGDEYVAAVSSAATVLTIKGVPAFSGLSASQSISNGTTGLTLGGRLSTAAALYPAAGETITVTIEGNPQTATVNDNTGDFVVNYNPSSIPVSPLPYIIAYSYAGNAWLTTAADSTTALTIQPVTTFWAGRVDANWSTPDNAGRFNWASDATGATTAGAPPVAATAVIFSATNGVTSFNTSVNADFTIKNLLFMGASNVTIGGVHALTINDPSGLTVAATAGSVTISNSQVVLGSSQKWANLSTNALTVNATISGAANLTNAGPGIILLDATNTYTGDTILSQGTLALGSNGSISNSPLIAIGAGATYDVSAISAYALAGGATLSASGAALAPATINGAAGGTVSFGSQPITLEIDGSAPALTVVQGTLVLDGGNVISVNSSSPLGVGSYPLIYQTIGNISYSGYLSVTGTAIPAGAIGSLSIVGGNMSLTVLLQPSFSNLSPSQSAMAGSTVTLRGTISASGPFYPAQGESVLVTSGYTSWQYATIYDATGDFSLLFDLSGISPDATPYYIEYYYPGDSLFASVADVSTTLTVSPATPPTITRQPLGANVVPGQPASVSITASSATPVTYEWLKDGVLLPNQTNNALGFVPFQFTNSGAYQVVVSNAGGLEISMPALLGASNAPLRVWGNDQYSQLGDGGVSSVFLPEELATNAVAEAMGSQYSFFVTADGALWAMGYDFDGELGDGSAGDQPFPEQVTNNVVAVAAGEYHSLFLTADGTLWAMGQNASGQLGDGTTTDRPLPVQITNHVVAVAAGGYHSLFLTADGTLWAMGNNASGQLGDGGLESSASIPKPVASNVVTMAAGEQHTLYVTADGTLWAMGDNSVGELGDGGLETSTNLPERITNNVVAVAAGGVTNLSYGVGGAHSLFVKADGTLWVMGFNADGELGDGGSEISTNLPEEIPTSSAVTAVAAGGAHSFFVTADGSLWAMGDDTFGELGDYNGSSGVPILVNGGNFVTATLANGEGAFHALSVSGISPQVYIPAETTTNGQPFTFGADVYSGDGPFTYQWQYNYVNIPGATNASYPGSNAGANDQYAYLVIVTSPYGSAGAVGALTVIALPSITTLALQNNSAGPGLVLTFTVNPIQNYNVLVSTNLITWTSLGEFIPNGSGQLVVTDTSATTKNRFYKLEQ